MAVSESGDAVHPKRNKESGGRDPQSFDAYRVALLIRHTEKRLLDLFAEGKLFGTVHTCIGQELTGIAIARGLKQGDQIFSNHRCHGHFLAWTDDVHGLIAEIMGKESGVCGGRGGSQHLCAKGFFSNGIQGGISPVAAGLAMSHKMRSTGNIVALFIGDGTLGEGVLYETLNLSSKWELPLLVVLENNGYAQSTSQDQTLAGNICERASAFGIQTWRASTWNPEELMEAATAASSLVRGSVCPAFMQVDTYRLMAHSKGDDDRDPSEVQAFWEKDPVVVFSKSEPERVEEFTSEATERINNAVARAEDAPFARASLEARGQVTSEEPIWRPTDFSATGRVFTQIRDAFQRNMREDERILLLGEDIESPYGGAFKVTQGLSDEFPDRVRNTPISEALIVGMASGLAMNGFIPVCEIMFGDFLTLAADQLINHSAKFEYIYNGQVKVPMIVRTPMGGKRGYGATHSQSLENHFLGIPQTIMLAIHSRYDPGVIYDTVFRTIESPVIVIENKFLYSQRLAAKVPRGFHVEHTDDRFPTTRIRPDDDADLTIVCYGGTLPDTELAVFRGFDEFEIIGEIICPIQLYPLKLGPILESVRRTGKLLVVEEAQKFSGFGSEVIAQLGEVAPGLLKGVRRLAPPKHPIPSCGPLEQSILPNPDSIVGGMKELIGIG